MKLKRRAIVLLTTMAVVLVVGSRVALAATSIHCPNNTSGGPATVLFCYGTSEADTMDGSDLADYMYGKGGADTMHGSADSDSLYGEKGFDHIYGDSGADNYLWGAGEGTITNPYPDTSDDYVHGGSGADNIGGGYAQSGVDRIYGEGGNDSIDASQRKDPDPAAFQVTKEIIDCGVGASDEVYFDKGLDVVATNCEIKHPYS